MSSHPEESGNTNAETPEQRDVRVAGTVRSAVRDLQRIMNVAQSIGLRVELNEHHVETMGQRRQSILEIKIWRSL